MREEEEYKREVNVISIERDNKRLLDIYRRGEEKESLSERAFNNVYDRVEYALSASSLMYDTKMPELEERIRFFFEEYYFDNVPDSSSSDIRYYITAFKRFFLILEKEGEINRGRLSSLYSLLSEYL